MLLGQGRQDLIDHLVCMFGLQLVRLLTDGAQLLARAFALPGE